MKKILTLITAALVLSSTQLYAETIYTFEDTWKDWPGYDTTIGDELGTPRIEYLNVVESNGFLKSVQIATDGASSTWQEFNSLFINSYALSGGANEAWNFFVHDDRGTIENHGLSNIPSNGIFTVDAGFQYTYAAGSGVRAGNPNGIHSGYLNPLSGGTHWAITGQDALGNSIWTYSFDDGLIDLSKGFAVAFAPWCANDVIGGEMNPVPEPATMALVGLGLLGLAGLARRRFPH